MSKVIALLILLCSAQAFGGPQCAPFGPGASGFKITLAPTANLTQWSSNSGAYYVTSWWCEGKYKPTGWYYIGARTDLPSNWMSEIQKVPSASLDALLAAQTKYMTKRLSPEQKAAGEAQLEATKPAFPAYVVAKNGSYPDRPLYRVEDGVRGKAVSGVRAAVGSACACYSFVMEEGKSTYCPLAGSPPELDKVALCKL
jgi:hypothetical protein